MHIVRRSAQRYNDYAERGTYIPDWMAAPSRGLLDRPARLRPGAVATVGSGDGRKYFRGDGFDAARLPVAYDSMLRKMTLRISM